MRAARALPPCTAFVHAGCQPWRRPAVGTRAHKSAGCPVCRSSSFPPSRPHSWRWHTASARPSRRTLSGLAAQTALGRSVPVLRPTARRG